MARGVMSNSCASSVMVKVRAASRAASLRSRLSFGRARLMTYTDVYVNVNVLEASPPPMANAREAELNYPLGEALPAPGASLEVAPGVRWIRMRLPFALDHINLWLLRDSLDGVEGWTVVDCCIAHDEARAQWEQIFETQLQGMPILRVIVTHMHPDHIGLAEWLCSRWNAPLWIS